MIEKKVLPLQRNKIYMIWNKENTLSMITGIVLSPKV